MLLALTIDPIPGYSNIPTFKQLFGKDTKNATGVMGPAGIPEPIVKKLEKAVAEGTKAPAFRKMIEKMNMLPNPRSSRKLIEEVNAGLVTFNELMGDLDLLKKK
jgi:tripartite-type tricarboxylate transporter receptor subunit TctC